MHKLKVGDKVRRVVRDNGPIKIGDVGIIIDSYANSTYRLDIDPLTINAGQFLELVEEKEKEMKFNLKTDRWLIIVNSAEESKAAQQWLFAQGMTWASGSKTVMDFVSFPKILTNIYYDGSGVETHGFMYSDTSRYQGFAHEIKLQFATVVDNATYPEVESKKDKEIKAVREEMQKLAERLKVLES